MENNQRTPAWEQHLRKITIFANTISTVVALVVAMGVGYGFYYKTNKNMQDNADDITELKKNIKETSMQINNIRVYKGVSEAELNALKNDVNRINNQVEKFDEKVDKISDKIDQVLIQTRKL